MFQHQHPRKLLLSFAVAGITSLTLYGCQLGKEETKVDPNHSAVKLSLNLPASMTGADSSSTSARGMHLAATRSSPCWYPGVADEEPFRNGYNMNKFMVSAVATWTCVADTAIEIVNYVPHDGDIHHTKNDTQADNYKSDEPTHYSVSDDTATQTTVRLYYGYDRATPPTADSHPGFFLAWNKTSDDDLAGRIVFDAMEVNPQRENKEDPVIMRMDFTYSAQQKFATMYLQFDDNNPWADGLRIEVTQDLLANPLNQVFTARGLMAMKAQFSPADGISELPRLQMFTVADQLGEGATAAEFADLSLALPLNASSGNHLGNYLFTKTDLYFFDADQSTSEPWDYIYKTVTASTYRGGRTTPASGGTWLPFDPSQDMIINALQLDANYFTGSACAAVGDDCNALLNAIIRDGFAGQEKNQGADPGDWRSSAIAAPAYLSTVYPNGSDWTDAFTMEFTPAP